jgi:hypothetical protein
MILVSNVIRCIYFEIKSYLCFKFSPCFECSLLSFGQVPGVCVLLADVSELSIDSILMPTKMEPIESSETSANNTHAGDLPKRKKTIRTLPILLNVTFGGKCSRPNHWILKVYTYAMRTSGYESVALHVSVLYSRCG